jgi:hypothetical protein
MAKRLSVKHRKIARDRKRAYKAGEAPAAHKVAVERSEKARFKNSHRAV